MSLYKRVFANRFCKFEWAVMPLLPVISSLANLKTEGEGANRPRRSAKNGTEGWSLLSNIRAFRVFCSYEFTKTARNNLPLERLCRWSMAVLSNIRVDFPGFSLKIVEHSR
jgi:hypothetical protein